MSSGPIPPEPPRSDGCAELPAVGAREAFAQTVAHCPHAPRCPGCPWIGQPYALGLDAKRREIERALGRYPELAPAIEPVRPAPQMTHYRLRAKLVVEGGRIGLFAAGTHDVVDIPGCPVLAPEIEAAASALRSMLPLEVSLSAVDLRVCDSGVLVCLVCDERPAPEVVARCRERVLRDVPKLAGLAFSFREPGSVQLLGGVPVVSAGQEEEPHHLSSGAPWHYASHGAFTQVHAGQATLLHEAIERGLAQGLGSLRGQRVLELYAGSGALGLRLAARGAGMTLVEGFAPAAARIEGAARAQGLQVDALALTAETFLESAASRGAPGFDAVIVNPPRRGLSPGVRDALARLAPRLITYVSCEPQTLARDLSHLALLGWAAPAVAGFDMIPLSDAVECLVVLEPRQPPAPRVLFENGRAIALYKQPFEPTTPQGESASSLLDRARKALALPQLTPVHRLDAGTSGVCWFAREPRDVSEIAAALAAGEKTYVALAHGVTRSKGKIDRPLVEGGKRRAALTRYRRRRVVGGHSLLELVPEQGRKHQLRRHLASIGHPILGDERYGRAASNRHFEHRHGLDRPFLHCTRARLELPEGAVEVVADLPGDLEAVLASLGPER